MLVVQQLSSQLNQEKALLEEELHKINEDIRRKQVEVEGTLKLQQFHCISSTCLLILFAILTG